MAETTRPVEEIIEEETSAVSPEITVDTNHSSLTGIRADQEADVKAITDGYNTQIAGVDTMVASQQSAIDRSSQAEIDAQNQYTKDTINIIEGQKEEARGDLADEQRGAYVDWKQATDPFGVNAEKMAANGLSGSGYSETSKVRMYQAYQSRKALAYKAFSKAITEYNNQITMARSQNSVTIAQIASNAIKEKARIALEGFYYKNDLITKQTDAITETNRYYDSLWLDQYDRLYEQEKDKRDFLQRQAEERQAQENWQAEFDQEQANWEALYGEDGLYRKEEEEEEEEEVIIDKGEDEEDEIPPGSNAFADPDNAGVDDGDVFPTAPTLSTGSPMQDGKLGGQVPQPLPGIKLDLDTKNGKPNYPMLPNGNPAFLTLEQVGADNINSVNDEPIRKAFGNISAEQLEALVNMGAVKEQLYKDKDGKIGMTFIIKDEAKAKEYLGSNKQTGNSGGTKNTSSNLWQSILEVINKGIEGIIYSGSGGSGWIK